MSAFEYKITLGFKHPKSNLQKEYGALKTILGVYIGELKEVGAPRLDPKGNALPGVYLESRFGLSLSDKWQKNNYQPLEDALGNFLDTINPLAEILQNVTRTGGKLDLFIGIKIEFNGGIAFSPSLLKRMVDFNIELGLDIYSEERRVN